MKRFQLMQRVNPEGLYGTIQASLPHLKKAVAGADADAAVAAGGSGRIIVVSPPIYSRFFRGKTAYAMGKVSMSVLTKGLAMDLERQGLADRMAITSIWPAVAIESGATRAMLLANPDEARDLRKPTIFSDAILAMLRAPAAVVNGRLELDEDFLRTHEGGGLLTLTLTSTLSSLGVHQIQTIRTMEKTGKHRGGSCLKSFPTCGWRSRTTRARG
ncbi:citronellol/citronellal dehydrogenase [Microdochium nivale]|nr:citronellol/citronellal dehydrogenase [Microdochium nivale]